MAGRQIVLEPYNPAWPAQFAEEEKRVREVLGDVALAVHHIGSTSVPGLAAKPVIDMLIEVSGLSALDDCNAVMQALGYTPRGEYGIPGRRYYPPDPPLSVMLNPFRKREIPIVPFFTIGMLIESARAGRWLYD